MSLTVFLNPIFFPSSSGKFLGLSYIAKCKDPIFSSILRILITNSPENVLEKEEQIEK